MGTNGSTGSSVWTWGRTSSLWGWQSTGTGCPGRLWSLLLWRYWRPTWTRSCAACCRWPCFVRRVGLDDPQRSLPTLTILWFCDSVILWFFFKAKHEMKICYFCFLVKCWNKHILSKHIRVKTWQDSILIKEMLHQTNARLGLSIVAGALVLTKTRYFQHGHHCPFHTLIFAPLVLSRGSGHVRTSGPVPTTALPLEHCGPGHVLPTAGRRKAGPLHQQAGSQPMMCQGWEKLVDHWP